MATYSTFTDSLTGSVSKSTHPDLPLLMYLNQRQSDAPRHYFQGHVRNIPSMQKVVYTATDRHAVMPPADPRDFLQCRRCDVEDY